MKRKLVYAFLLLLLALIGLGGFVFGSQAGLRWSLPYLIDFLPGELQIEQARGRWAGPLHLQGVRYRQDDLQVQVRSVQLHWRPGRLLRAWVELDALEVDGLRVRMPSSPASTEPAAVTQLPEIELPVKVHIRRLALDEFVLENADGTVAQTVDALRLAARWTKAGLEINKLELAAPQGQVALRGAVDPRGAYPMDVELDWRIQADGGPAYAGQGRIKGDVRALTLQHALQTPFPAQFDGRLEELLGALRWQGRLEIADWVDLGGELGWPGLQIAGDVEGAGGLEQAEVTAKLRGRAPQLGQWNLQLRGRRDNAVLHVEDIDLTQGGAGGARLQGKATLDLAAGGPHVDTALNWRQLAWPPVGTPQLRSPRGELKLKGTSAAYTVALQTGIAGAALPAGDWRLKGRGDAEQLHIDKLSVRTLQGQLQGQGRLAWRPRLAWDMKLAGQDLNPGVQWREWPGKVRFSARSEGRYEGERVQAQLHLEQLAGRLRQRSLSGRAQVKLAGDQWDIQQLSLRSGQAQLSLQGRYRAQDVDLQAAIQAGDLQDLHPAARGSLQGGGQIKGPLDGLKVNARLQGSRLAFEEFALRSLQLQARLDLQDETDSVIDMQARGVRSASTALGDWRAQGRGRLARHELDVRQEGAKQRSLVVALRGGYKEGVWDANLQTAAWRHPQWGAWDLQQGVRLRIGAAQVSVSPACWTRSSAQICLQAETLGSEAWRGSLSLQQLPLAWVAALGAAPLDVDGSVGGQAQWTWRAGALAGLQGKFEFGAGRLKARAGPNAPGALEWRHDGASLVLEQQGAALEARFALRPTKAVRLQAEARVGLPGADAAWERQSLGGHVQVGIEDLGIIETLLPQVRDVTGKLDVDMRLAGTVGVPRWSGNARLSGGSAQIPRIGITLQDLGMTVHSAGTDQFKLQAAARSGPGKLSVQGTLGLPAAAQPEIALRIEGERFQVVKIPEAMVLASPRMSLKVQGSRIDALGQVHIDEARLEPRDLTQSVTTSADTVIVGRQEPAQPPSKWDIHSQIRVTLSDRVEVKGFGFEGAITGNLLLIEEPGKLGTGRGELVIKRGTYKAYGQELTIQKGKLLFADSLVDDPGLDIRAVRTIGDVTAGVKVRGTAKAPTLNLFSDPRMEQADILSYLTVGRPVSQLSQSEGQALASAASSAGLAGGEYIAGWIGERLGFDQVSIESNGDQQQTQLVIGTYLSPRLYISYGVGLFEPGNTVQIRYKLSPKFTIQGESGAQSGADILFTF